MSDQKIAQLERQVASLRRENIEARATWAHVARGLVRENAKLRAQVEHLSAAHAIPAGMVYDPVYDGLVPVNPADPRSEALSRAMQLDQPLDGYAQRR